MKYLWLILMIAAIAWYILVTVYVAYKGVGDIKQMLRRLSDRK